MAVPIPYSIHVPAEAIKDLKQRLQHTRWPDEVQGADGWEYGTNIKYLQELVAYWQNKYSWEERQAALNKQLQQFRMPINGIDVHFAHHRSEDPHAVPLLLIHGWPSSFVEFVDILPLLNNLAEHCILAVVMLCAEGTHLQSWEHAAEQASRFPVSLVVLLHFVSTA